MRRCAKLVAAGAAVLGAAVGTAGPAWSVPPELTSPASHFVSSGGGAVHTVITPRGFTHVNVIPTDPCRAAGPQPVCSTTF
jgi:hypothetical protein